MTDMETLHCQIGDHTWERERVRGRKPFNCPQHKPEVAPTREAAPSRANASIIARIEAVWDQLHEDDRGPLDYIRKALTPERIANRHPEDAAVDHLHAVAKQRLRRYEKSQTL